MLDTIIQADQKLFYLINQKFHNPLFDKWMPFITDVDNWVWVLALAGLGLFVFGKRRGKWACITVVVAVLFADNFNSYILKPFFGRLRPGLVLEEVRIFGEVPSDIPSPAFPSGHAVNVFAMAMAMSFYYRRLAPVFFMGAGLVGYSRVYIGVHYPLDVIAGAFVGIICALCFLWCARKTFPFFKRGIIPKE